MSERGDEILSAGPLTGEDDSFECMPSVAAGSSGGFALAYLTREQRETSWRLHIAALSLEKATHTPVIVGSPAPAQEPPDRLLPIPPTFSSDGESVFASTEDGRITKHSLASFIQRTR